MDDCGSCSPEPRAYFRYDKKRGKYLPAKGIAQDFVKEGHKNTEEWLEENFAKLGALEAEVKEHEFHRSLLSHTIDLIYIGEQKKAWKLFNKYYAPGKYKEEVRMEIKRRLRQSAFYRALR